MIKIIIKSLWISFAAFWLILLFWVFAVKGDWIGMFGKIPDYELLENPDNPTASVILSEDGREIGKYYETDRVNVQFHEISKAVIKSLIATEDARFEDHSGIDFIATLRVIGSLGKGGGGSTISQQLAKNLFRMRRDDEFTSWLYRTPLRMPIIKTKEWVTATRLEKAYTKEEIITMYLNTVNFGISATGINSAAHTYFNKTARDLSISEAATLVGTLKANSSYDPVINPEKSKERRNVVLYLLKKHDYLAGLNDKQYDSLLHAPLVTEYKAQDYLHGIAAHFRGELKNEVYTICDSLGYDLLSDGLKIHTSINYRLQLHAERAVNEEMKKLQKKFLSEWGNKEPWPEGFVKSSIQHTAIYQQLAKKHQAQPKAIWDELEKKVQTKVFTYNGVKDTLISPLDKFKHHKKFLHTGFLATDPYTGQVRAWVGGINKKFFSYDHVKQSQRQPGSTFKPVLYSAAINNGYSPCDRKLDVPVAIRTPSGDMWEPAVKPSNEEIDLKTALAKSLNNFAALLMRDIGAHTVIEHAEQMGVPKGKLAPNLSLALGTSDLSIFDLIGVYTTFVNSGRYIEPHYLIKIEDEFGKIIYQKDPETRHVMSEFNAYKMVTMLRGGAIYGTGKTLKDTYHLLDDGNQIGGKTGTTQASKDGWFFGISKYLVCGSWVGLDDQRLSFRYRNRWYGGNMALPIYARFMQLAYNDQQVGIKPSPFDMPDLTDEQIINDIRCDKDSTGNILLNYGDNRDEPF